MLNSKIDRILLRIERELQSAETMEAATIRNSRIERNLHSSEFMEAATTASREKKNAPKWFDEWLKNQIFEVGRRCKQHEYQHETIFCYECVGLGRTFCPVCWRNSEHNGHKCIQVTACSNRTSVKIVSISEFWDVSEIQNYIINRNKVIFLNSDKEPTQKQSNGKPSCKACSRKLIDSKFKFCSIACNKQMIESGWVPESKPVANKPIANEYLMPVVHKLERVLPEVQKQLPSLKPENRMERVLPEVQKQLPSLRPEHRKRKRKGVPRRAPLK